jgi:hypothetical protein
MWSALLMSSWPANKVPSSSAGRRSQRVVLSVPVTIRTEDGPQGAGFKEQTQTLVVNVHGALIALAGRLDKGQTLHLTNNATHEELPCRVIYVGPTSGGKAQIGVEFTTPSPDFWRITFPPEDWSSPDQALATGKTPGRREPQPAPTAKKP